MLFATDSYLQNEYNMTVTVCQEENENNSHFILTERKLHLQQLPLAEKKLRTG
jgi:hypothetical protein